MSENWHAYFDGEDRGLVFLNSSGRVCDLSPMAEQLLTRFKLWAAGKIQLKEAGANARLQNLIAWSIQDPAPALPQPLPVVMSTGSGSSLVFDVFPIPPKLRSFPPEAVAMMAVRQAEDRTTDRETLLAKQFGLSPAEVRVALGVADGIALKAIAASAGVMESTARQQLKAVFRKTGVSGQVRLARLISQLN